MAIICDGDGTFQNNQIWKWNSAKSTRNCVDFHSKSWPDGGKSRHFIEQRKPSRLGAKNLSHVILNSLLWPLCVAASHGSKITSTNIRNWTLLTFLFNKLVDYYLFHFHEGEVTISWISQDFYPINFFSLRVHSLKFWLVMTRKVRRVRSYRLSVEKILRGRNSLADWELHWDGIMWIFEWNWGSLGKSWIKVRVKFDTVHWLMKMLENQIDFIRDFISWFVPLQLPCNISLLFSV